MVKQTFYFLGLLFILCSVFTSYGQVTPKERQALIDLYNATNGDNWKNTLEGNQPWLIDDPESKVKDWYGIKVVGETVNTIYLNRNNLSGTLPESIGDLTSVTTIVFTDNNISGELPESLNKLMALRSLQLSRNEFTGELPILKLINSKNLTHLYFDGNNFSGEIPKEIGGFPDLMYLNFSNNQLTGTIPVEVSNLSNLKLLYFSRNSISGSIPPEISKMNNLTSLSFSDNNLTGAIPAELGNMKNIGSLSFGGNEFTGSIPPELGNLKSLFSLSFNNNQLTGSIPPELGNLNEIVRLYIADNNLTGSIPTEFGQLKKLENLQLGDNQLSGEIPSSLGLLPQLKRIGIRNNQLTGSIPESFGQLRTLEHLHLHGNNLTGAIPSSFGALVNLKALYVYGNNLSGKIPPSISILPNLNDFGISGNEFVFSDFEDDFVAFDTNISSFKYNIMKRVDSEDVINVVEGESITFKADVFTSPNNNYQWYKNNSRIAGATSKEYTIENVKISDVGVYSLRVSNSVVEGLKIYRNDITLTVEEVVDTCGVSEEEKQALIDLYNSTNGSGWTNNTNWLTDAPVCDWYGVVVEDGKIIQLFLNNNNLVGSIPSSIQDLNALKELYLRQNALSGSIPTSISALSNLVTIYLDYNQLTGIIPNNVGSLSNLEFLFINNNNLTGGLPSSIGDLESLINLSLNNNELQGPIPNEFSRLINLENLRLDSNNFSGVIPDLLAELPSLKNLQLDQNALSGRIPYFNNPGIFVVFTFKNNEFVFSDFENEYLTYDELPLFNYAPQAKVDQIETVSVTDGGSITLTSTALTSPNNSYQWYKDGLAIAGATSKDLMITNASDTDAGVYHFTATNSVVTDLTLERNPITLTVSEVVDTCGVSESEKQALIDLYNSTNGANWTNNTNWLTDAPVCDWYGVTVEDGKIAKLILSINNLIGDIPISLAQLINLSDLRLNGNQLSGNIPSELGEMTNLKIMFLFTNKLTGSIPSSFGRLSSLQKLYLSDNKFTGSIPPSFGGLSSLQSLYLSENELIGSIPSEFGQLTNLVDLRLNGNQLSGNIPSELGEMISLKTMFLFTNKLTGSIPSSFGRLSSLRYLFLSDNELSGVIPDELVQLSNLERLTLNNNKFSGIIPSSVTQLANLINLRIGDNKFIFNDFETQFNEITSKLGAQFTYSPQAKVDQPEALTVNLNESITLTSNILTSTNNSYQWYKDGEVITGATNKDLVLENVSLSDAGVYHFIATNSIVINLTLERNPITVTVNETVDQLEVTINTKNLPTSDFEVISGTTTITDLLSGTDDSETDINLGEDDGEDKLVMIKVKASQAFNTLNLRFTVNTNGISNVEVFNNNNWLDFSPEFYRIEGNTIYFENKKASPTIPFTLNLINGVQYDSQSGPFTLLIKNNIDLTGATLEIIFPNVFGGEEGEFFNLSEGSRRRSGRTMEGEGTSSTGLRNSQIIQPDLTINGFQVDGTFWSSGSYKFVLSIQGKIFNGAFIVKGSGGDGEGEGEF